MHEFEEIAHSGGKVSLRQDKDGTWLNEWKNDNAGRTMLFMLRVSLDGKLLGIVQNLRYSPSGPPLSKPSLNVVLSSDKEGLYGRTCPDCKSYFRTDCVTVDTFCPYCGHTSHCLDFTTPNQLEYIEQVCNAFVQAYNEGQSVTIDLDHLISQLPDNRPQWVYSEERQQTYFECKGCKTRVDILGNYGGCPKCGKRNSLDKINSKLDELQAQFARTDEEIRDRHEREVEWEKLLRCVSEFEAMANDIRTQLLRLPAIPKRKSDLSSLGFLNIEKANSCFNNWYGFEILDGINDGDRRFMTTMFCRRHIFTHNAGKVDQEYLDNSGDHSVRLNQVIRLSSKDIRRLLPLIRSAAKNLVTGVESIS